MNISLAEPLGMGLNTHAKVERVNAGGQAERAFVTVGSRVCEVNGKAVDNVKEIKACLAEAKQSGSAAVDLVLLAPGVC